jgi:hypothetical protein
MVQAFVVPPSGGPHGTFCQLPPEGGTTNQNTTGPEFQKSFHLVLTISFTILINNCVTSGLAPVI